MATTTTNLALIKPAGTDKIRIAQINSNMDILDDKIGPVGNTSLQEQLNNKQGALTFDSAPTSGSTNPVTSGGVYNAEQSVRNTVSIVATGNTAPKAITAGEFVQWQGAIYTATANIASGGTLNTSNLQAVPNGGLNSLKAGLDLLNSNLTTYTMGMNGRVRYLKVGMIVCVFILYVPSEPEIQTGNWFTIGTLPEGYRPVEGAVDFLCYDNSVSESQVEYTAISCRINTDGSVVVWTYKKNAVPVGSVSFISVS